MKSSMKLNAINVKKLTGKNKVVKFDYAKYMSACKLIAQDIKDKYDLTRNDIELVGIARGGLPMLVTLSHLLDIRRISMIQTQMSNSDNCHDYGNFRYMNDNLDDTKRKCILFEDIIYKGKTTNGVINKLKEKNKEICAVYSLIIDEGFKDIEIDNSDVEINYIYEIKKDDWVYFFWETDLNEIN